MKFIVNTFVEITSSDYQKSGVYCIFNISNGKIYIGSSGQLGKRKITHISDLKNNKHSNNHLQNAWNKYGSHSFKFYILEIFDDCSLLLSKEQYYLDLYQSYNHDIGYNIDIKSARNILSENTKAKIGQSNSLFYNSDEKIAEMRCKIHKRIMNALENPVKENLKSISACRRAQTERGEYNGIIWDKDREKWNLKISINGKRIYLGLFESKEKALSFKSYIASKYHIYDVLFP